MKKKEGAWLFAGHSLVISRKKPYLCHYIWMSVRKNNRYSSVEWNL